MKLACEAFFKSTYLYPGSDSDEALFVWFQQETEYLVTHTAHVCNS